MPRASSRARMIDLFGAIACEPVGKAANLRTISPFEDEKDQSFQDSFKRLRS